ncbi:MAG: type II toxin-antitoxin system prevent-host-death family antitoxin [Thermoleophilaceae bacterium]
MRQVGVRELKNDLSGWLRRVDRGEQIRVTVRGRPVADLVPAGRPRDRMQQLIAEGKVTPASRPMTKPALPPEAGRGSATELILAEREDER